MKHLRSPNHRDSIFHGPMLQLIEAYCPQVADVLIATSGIVVAHPRDPENYSKIFCGGRAYTIPVSYF